MNSNYVTSSKFTIKLWHRHMRSIVTIWALLAFISMLLISCTTTPDITGTTQQQIPATPKATQQTTQQYEFTAQDSGKALTYTVTSRFGIVLNQDKYPKQQMQVSCHLQNSLGTVSNIPSVSLPLYVVRYQAVQADICTIKNGTFHLTVRIISLDE